MSETEKTLYIENARNYPQCELFLLKGGPGKWEALVYNTTGLNTCPPEKYDSMDPVELAKQSQSNRVWKNPRRFWVMDHLTLLLAGEPRDFDGLMFHFVARMQMPLAFTPEVGQAAIAYKPTQIRRVTTYEYLAGRPVFMLRSPDGHTFVMQTYTNHVDRTLTEADLPNLARRLKPGEGWQFKSKTLERNLVIDTTGLAHIVADDLANMYQGCIDNVCNFDPW